MSDHDNLIFRGIDAAECEEFIRSVRRVALSRGKQNDNAWIAQYAGACFGGAALRWFERLDDDVQDDWKRLRIAMLDRWHDDGNDDDLGAEPSFSAMVPTPPAAAPPPMPARRPISKSESENLSHVFENLSLTTRRGLVCLDTLEGKFYVYQTRNSSGSFGTTSRREYALSVEYDVGPPPHRIRVKNVDKCSWLAVKWNSTVAIGAGATKPVGLVALDDSDAFQSYDSNRRKWKGPQRSVVWAVASDGTLQAFWEEGATCVLSALWRPTDHLIMLVADPESYVAKYPHWKRARLVFEAVQ